MFGVGENLITSRSEPVFGGVYKLCAVKEGDEYAPRIKISESAEKVTTPGFKKLYRLYDKETGKIRADLICLDYEKYNEKDDLRIFDPIDTWKKLKLEGGTYTLRELLVPIFKNCICVYESPTTMQIKEYCAGQLNTLWDESRRLVNPQKVYVDLSKPLYDLKQQLLNEGNEE